MSDLSDWLWRYKNAWETRNGRGASELFVADGVYRAHPLREPYVGRAAIEKYWNEGSGTQEDIHMTIRKPLLVDGRYVASEWYTTLKYEGEETILVGSLFLDFADDGLCRELREYYFIESGSLKRPPSAWT